MSDKLKAHVAKQEAVVNGWDMLSIGLGLFGAALLGVSIAQPKHGMNAYRIPLGVSLLAASVGVERLRESDLESLEKGQEYLKSIKSETIRRDTLRKQVLRDVEEDQMIFRAAPKSMWGELSQRLQLNPPPEPEPPQAVSIPEPVSQGIATAVQEDPCAAGYDPEQPAEESSGLSFIPAGQVKAWFHEMVDKGYDIKWLVEEWQTNPGTGIRVDNGKAMVIRDDS